MDFDHFLAFCSFLIFWIAPGAAFIYFAYSTDLFRVTWENTKRTLSRVTNLKALVSSKYSGLFSILFYTIKMILKTLWINFLQYMNNNVVKGKKYYEISFVITGKLYKVLVEVKRGPEDIIQISDENYDDVTEVLIPYFRAQRSTIVNLTPKILEHENLQFLTASEDDPYNFSNDEFIRLKKE